MTDRFLCQAAVCATLAIHGVLLGFLFVRPTVRAPEIRKAADEAALQVVWITPEGAPARRTAEAEPASPAASARSAGRKPRRSLQKTEEGSGPSPGDPVSRTEPARPPLDLSLSATGIQYADDLMSRGRARAMPQPERMELHFVDSSFGGTLQRMTRAGTCGDLRAALQQRPESAMTIYQAMARLGC